jgi:hypothetical protein
MPQRINYECLFSRTVCSRDVDVDGVESNKYCSHIFDDVGDLSD